jgi:hypothetical protein
LIGKKTDDPQQSGNPQSGGHRHKTAHFFATLKKQPRFALTMVRRNT